MQMTHLILKKVSSVDRNWILVEGGVGKHPIPAMSSAQLQLVLAVTLLLCLLWGF